MKTKPTHKGECKHHRITFDAVETTCDDCGKNLSKRFMTEWIKNPPEITPSKPKQEDKIYEYLDNAYQHGRYGHSPDALMVYARNIRLYLKEEKQRSYLEGQNSTFSIMGEAGKEIERLKKQVDGLVNKLLKTK